MAGCCVMLNRLPAPARARRIRAPVFEGVSPMREGFDNDKYIAAAGRTYPRAHRAVRRQALSGIRRQALRRLPCLARAARLRAGQQDRACCNAAEGRRAEIVIAINANDIERNKRARRPRHHLRRGRAAPHRRLPLHRASYVGSVVITRYADQPAADAVPHSGWKTMGITRLPALPHRGLSLTTSTTSSPTRATAKTTTSKPSAPSSW